jgi:2-oxoglutarate ferredoxin oxidoreductase subunit gamma
MLERVLIAGSGGQGVLLIGRLLARAAMDCVPHVTYFPSYGAEVRGGTSNCQVVLSGAEIHSPLSDRFEAMLILNQESTARFLPRRSADTLVVLNTSLCDPGEDGRIVSIRATDIANELGEIRVANFVMLGAYLARHPVVSAETIERCIREELEGKSPALVDMNIEAFGVGLRSVL